MALIACGLGPFLIADAPDLRPANSQSSARVAGPQLRTCGVADLTNRDVALIERLAEIQQRRLGINPNQVAPAAGVIPTIQVAFHVVYYDDGSFQFALLTPADIDLQIQALNAAYPNFNFVLASTSFTNDLNLNFLLHTPGSAEERLMKSSLGLDTSRYLNIYSTYLSFSGLLGYATFPWDQRNKPALDGVVISFDTLPGGLFPYDEGDTAVHEVGHWLGLYHTFQGGCSFLNDRVFDTPAEAAPFYGCSLMKPDTCPATGLDPINNYMDYSDDACLNQFTPGQIGRMNLMTRIFRPNALN